MTTIKRDDWERVGRTIRLYCPKCWRRIDVPAGQFDGAKPGVARVKCPIRRCGFHEDVSLAGYKPDKEKS